MRPLIFGALVVLIAVTGYWSGRRSADRSVVRDAVVADNAQRARLERLKSEAEAALDKYDLKTAAQKIAALRQAGWGATAAGLQKRYEELAGERDVNERYASARSAYERVRKVDRSQGLGARLDAIAAAWARGEDARQRASWGIALSAYDEVASLCAEVTAMEERRGLARGLLDDATQAKDKAEQAYDTHDQGMKAEADAWMAKGIRAWLAGTESYEKGDFERAATLWTEARDAYVSSLPESEEKREYRRAKRAYEEALVAADELLRVYAPDQWQEFHRQDFMSGDAAKDPVAGARLYAEALERLNIAITSAGQLVSADRERIVASLDRGIADAGAEERKQELASVRERVTEALSRNDFPVAVQLIAAAGMQADPQPPGPGVMVNNRTVQIIEEPKRPPRPDQTKDEKPAGPIANQAWSFSGTNLGGAEGTDLLFVPVAAGEFWMGALDGGPEVQPVRRVSFGRPFWIGKREVSQSQWVSMMGVNPSNVKGLDLPVENTTWEESVEFGKKLTIRARELKLLSEDFEIRLPTEAEWEFAAKGGNKSDGYRFSGGNVLEEVGWYSGNSGMTTHKGGLRKDNEIHAVDMSGNVAEWCLDGWHWSYADAPTDGSEWTQGDSETHVCRGGHWYDDGQFCVLAQRGTCSGSSRYVGVRLVVSSTHTGAVASASIKPTVSEKTAVRTSKGPELGKVWSSPATGIEFVWVDDLQFWVARHEVTYAQYRKKVEKHINAEYDSLTLCDNNQPVVLVSFEDAKAYAGWLTEKDRSKLGGLRYRVPSESEWMVFAQCGDGRVYPWGNWLPPRYGLNYSDSGSALKERIVDYADGFKVSCAVEQSGMNELGLFGVGGNVWECCSADGAEAVFGAWRGASWKEADEKELKCASRKISGLGAGGEDCGFRLVLSR